MRNKERLSKKGGLVIDGRIERSIENGGGIEFNLTYNPNIFSMSDEYADHILKRLEYEEDPETVCRLQKQLFEFRPDKVAKNLKSDV